MVLDLDIGDVYGVGGVEEFLKALFSPLRTPIGSPAVHDFFFQVSFGLFFKKKFSCSIFFFNLCPKSNM